MNAFDLARRLSVAREAIHAYLQESGVPQTADGFFPSRLTGDEDAEIAKLYTEKYFPLVKLEKELAIQMHNLAAEDCDPTVSSFRLDRLALTGEEDDATILEVVRAGR